MSSLTSSNLLLDYYKRHNITNYPKTKTGIPDMRSFINKKTFQQIISDETNSTTSVNECPICFEPITNGRAVLSCNHTFCLDCIIQHGRLTNTCPLCRCEFSTKPSKEKTQNLNDFDIQNIERSQQVALQIKSYKYKNEFIDFMDYLLIQFTFYSKANRPVEFVKTTMIGIRQLLKMSSQQLLIYCQQHLNES